MPTNLKFTPAGFVYGGGVIFAALLSEIIVLQFKLPFYQVVPFFSVQLLLGLYTLLIGAKNLVSLLVSDLILIAFVTLWAAIKVYSSSSYLEWVASYFFNTLSLLAVVFTVSAILVALLTFLNLGRVP